MESNPWRERWREGRIGFHLTAPNPLLVAHADVFPEGARVLVPLCGKSLDLGWLAARGHSVVGVELVEDAARAFFAEAGLSPERREDGPFIHYQSGNVEILVGDLFDANPVRLGQFDAVFDRASMIALPEPVRARYVPLVRSLLKPGGVVLLITLDADVGGGPPFALPDAEVRRLYAADGITVLGETDALEATGNLAARGAKWASERVYRIERDG